LEKKANEVVISTPLAVEIPSEGGKKEDWTGGRVHEE